MKVTRFEELIAWQKAQDLAVIIYETYAQNKDWGYKEHRFRYLITFRKASIEAQTLTLLDFLILQEHLVMR